MIPRIVKMIAVIGLLSYGVGAEQCQLSGGEGQKLLQANSSEEAIPQELSCPGPDDPKNFTACCYDQFQDEELEEEELEETGTEAPSVTTTAGDVDEATTTAIPDAPKASPLRQRRKVRCCAPAPPKPGFLDYLISLDDRICRVALVIAMAALGTLLVATLLLIICCFWSKCPLYTACRAKYDKSDIIASGGDEETANLTDMPNEEKDGMKNYAPNEVKVTTLNEEEQQPLVEKKEEKKEEKKKEDKKKEEKKKKEEEKKKKEEEKKKKEEEKKKEKEEKKKKDEKKKEEKPEEKAEEKKEEKTEKTETKTEEKPAEEKQPEAKKEEPVENKEEPTEKKEESKEEK